MISFIVLVISFIIGFLANQHLGMRLSQKRMVVGVSGAIAEKFSIDITIVRILLVLLLFVGGVTIPAYFGFALGLSKK